MLAFERLTKRAFDICFTIAASVILLPIAFIVACLIWLVYGTPVLHRAERVGKDGNGFTLYKFRTMIPGAHRYGPGVTRRDDPRVTTLGRILRRIKFDEFPQVLNILRGDMSIVGPRPEAPQYVREYSNEQRVALKMRPGLTSLAQILYRDEEGVLARIDTEEHYLREVMPAKLELDLYYVRNWSLCLDARVFLLGLIALFGPSPPMWLWPVGLKMPQVSEYRA